MLIQPQFSHNIGIFLSGRGRAHLYNLTCLNTFLLPLHSFQLSAAHNTTDNHVEAYTPSKAPVLRLRPTPENEEIREEQLDLLRCLDGPLARHPDEIKEYVCTLPNVQIPLNIEVESCHTFHQERMAALEKYWFQWPKSETSGQIELMGVSVITRQVDMERMLEKSKDEVEASIERNFVHCDAHAVHHIPKKLC